MGQSNQQEQPQRWEAKLLRDGKNDGRLSPIFDAKTRFATLGIQFPEGFITPLLVAENAEDSADVGTRVVITLAVVRDEAGQLLSAEIGMELHPIGMDERGEALRPRMQMSGTLNYVRPHLLTDDILEGEGGGDRRAGQQIPEIGA